MSDNFADDPTRNKKTERLNEMAYGFKKTGSLLAAIEFGVFTAISEGAGTAVEIAGRTAVEEESIDRLLTACKSLDLVREVNGRYENLSDVERYLVRSSPTYFGDFLVYQAKEGYDRWKELAKKIRGSGHPRPESRYLAMMRDPAEARKFTEAGYNASISLAHKLAKTFDFSKHKLWLDFAGGSGCYSIAACERNPNLKSVIADQPNVIPVAKDFVAKHKLEDRIQIIEGNFLEPNYPKGCDLISFITPLQGYMPEDLNRIFRYTHEALEPGGSILIVDYMLNDDKTGPLDPAFLNLDGIVDGHYLGRVNTGAEFKEFLTTVGFREVDVWWLMPHQLGVVTAVKPA
jgi:hypothetical protein